MEVAGSVRCQWAACAIMSMLQVLTMVLPVLTMFLTVRMTMAAARASRPAAVVQHRLQASHCCAAKVCSLELGPAEASRMPALDAEQGHAVGNCEPQAVQPLACSDNHT